MWQARKLNVCEDELLVSKFTSERCTIVTIVCKRPQMMIGILKRNVCDTHATL